MRRLVVGLLAILMVFGPTIVTAASTPEASDKHEVDVVVFVLEPFARIHGETCKPDIDETAIVRIEDSQRNAWSIRFSRAEFVDESNPYVPGESGCTISRTIEYEPRETYSVKLNDKMLIEVDGDYFLTHFNLTVVIDADGAVIDEQDGISVPTPVPTPMPTPTPEPLAPAGDQGDGTYLLRGYLTLHDNTARPSLARGTCQGGIGYDDIADGAQVVVRDGGNSILGIGELEFVEIPPDIMGCTFIFEIEVEESEFYQISTSRRGEMIFTFDRIEDDGWTIFLSLGS